MNNEFNQDMELDEEKLDQMKHAIYYLERANAKTDNKTSKTMRDEIQKIIVNIAEGRM